MASKFCIARLNESVQLVRFYEVFITSICVLNLVFSLVATIGNILVIRALRKASSIPPNVKTLFLSLASSDLTVGGTLTTNVRRHNGCNVEGGLVG